jgi:hypothetical protein
MLSALYLEEDSCYCRRVSLTEKEEIWNLSNDVVLFVPVAALLLGDGQEMPFCRPNDERTVAEHNDFDGTVALQMMLVVAIVLGGLDDQYWPSQPPRTLGYRTTSYGRLPNHIKSRISL